MRWRAKFPFSPKCLTDLAPIARDKRDHENLGRHFRPSADHHRLRDLFGCCVDERQGPSHCCAGSCNGRHRPWAQTRLGARLHTGELKIAAALSDAGALQEELKDFRRKVSDAGRAAYNARTGARNDLVLAVAIALWWARTSGPMTVIEPFPLV